jgi:hypothetical protein
MSSDKPQHIPYESAAPPRRRSICAIASFVASLLVFPWWRMIVMSRPFWDGHPLYPVRAFTEHIPMAFFPLVSIILAIVALTRIASDDELTGRSFAWAAITVTTISLLLFVGLIILVADNFPHPN